MTVRVDADLKAAVDAAARSQGISTTEFNERALKAALHTICHVCGRSSLPGSSPPGFSPQFEKWVADHKNHSVNQPMLITTVEGGAQWVYWVRFRDATEMRDGVLMVKVILDRQSHAGQDMAIPRGAIIGWRDDGEGRWYDNQRMLGFGDGNSRVLRRLAEIEQAEHARRVGLAPVRRGRAR